MRIKGLGIRISPISFVAKNPKYKRDHLINIKPDRKLHIREIIGDF